MLTRLLIQQPILLPKHKSNVTLPFKHGKEHQLGKQLKLMACLLSGDPCQVRAFHQKLKQQYSTPGDLEHKNNTKSFSTNGSHLLISGMQIPFIQLCIRCWNSGTRGWIDQEFSYSGINTARSTLSSFVVWEGNLSVGTLPMIQRFMKGVFPVAASRGGGGMRGRLPSDKPQP